MNKNTEKDEKPIIVAWVGTTDVTRMKKWINYELLQNDISAEKVYLLCSEQYLPEKTIL